MLFPKQEPRLFTQDTVETLNKDQYGVYGLFKPDTWVYVGKGDIRQRLLDHLNGDNPCIVREKPTHYVAEVIKNADDREKELIKELDPICNKKVG